MELSAATNADSKKAPSSFDRYMKEGSQDQFERSRLASSSTLSESSSCHFQAQDQSSHFMTYQLLDDRLVKTIMFVNPFVGCGYYVVNVEIGRYVYFPSENQFIFVNYCTVEEFEYDETTVSANGQIQVFEKRTIRQPRAIVRYCSHRSHTPTSNFADVVKREPVREEWPKLKQILADLKRSRQAIFRPCHIDAINANPTQIIEDKDERQLRRRCCCCNSDKCSKENVYQSDINSHKYKKRRYPEMNGDIEYLCSNQYRI